ncbi:MAG TPA: hypothetical protein VHI52_17895, partial [Verrucomicrobiae bacterium]|nr:hypothetical protein [Verrucomicrobiae bacterium]
MGLLAGGCCTRDKSGASAVSSAPQPYVRISKADSNVLSLQIAVRQFVPNRGKGPTVWLTGVSHIGEPAYYAALQKHLDQQSLVLFEGISERAQPAPGATQADSGASAAGASAADRSSLQSALAASMGLVFQLSAINYDRPNFRNSDLSVPELRQLLTTSEEGKSETSAGAQFNGLLQMMQGGSLFDSLLQTGLRFLGTSTRLRALGRLALIEVIGEIQGDLAQLQGLPPDMKQLLQVLLQRRNEKVL